MRRACRWYLARATELAPAHSQMLVPFARITAASQAECSSSRLSGDQYSCDVVTFLPTKIPSILQPIHATTIPVPRLLNLADNHHTRAPVVNDVCISLQLPTYAVSTSDTWKILIVSRRQQTVATWSNTCCLHDCRPKCRRLPFMQPPYPFPGCLNLANNHHANSLGCQ